MLVKKNSIFRNISERKLAEYKAKGYAPVEKAKADGKGKADGKDPKQ